MSLTKRSASRGRRLSAIGGHTNRLLDSAIREVEVAALGNEIELLVAVEA